MTVNVIVVVPAFPSETLASSIERRGLSSSFVPRAVRKDVAASFRGAVDALAKTTGPSNAKPRTRNAGSVRRP